MRTYGHRHTASLTDVPDVQDARQGSVGRWGRARLTRCTVLLLPFARSPGGPPRAHAWLGSPNEDVSRATMPGKGTNHLSSTPRAKLRLGSCAERPASRRLESNFESGISTSAGRVVGWNELTVCMNHKDGRHCGAAALRGRWLIHLYVDRVPVIESRAHDGGR